MNCAVTSYIVLTTDDLQTGLLLRHIKCFSIHPTSERNSKLEQVVKILFTKKKSILASVKMLCKSVRPFSPTVNLCGR